MRWLLALISGLSLPFAFSPFDIWPLAFVSLGLLFLLVLDVPARLAARIGWVYALPYFAIGVHWVYNSLHDFGAAAPPVAVFMTVLFVLVMTLFPAIACYFFSRLGAQPVANDRAGDESSKSPGLHSTRSVRAALLFAALWTLTELVRGSLFGGFPWLLVGYSQTDSVFRAFAPVLGVYGVGFLLVMSAALMASILDSLFRRNRQNRDRLFVPHLFNRAASAVTVALVVVAALLLLPVEFASPKDNTLRFRMVQGNIPQELKFSRERLIESLNIYTSLSEQDVEGVDIVVWPETAIPTTFANVEEALTPFVSRMTQKNVEVLSGGFHRDGDNTYNAFRQLGGDKALYTKRHLVPFGEYMPFRFLLDFVSRFVIIPMSDLSRGGGPRELMPIKGESLGLSICYEDVFGEEMAESFPGATILVNISNDAWFGDMPAPQQHQQIARMRALEFQRPLLRVTNTGISSAINEKGKIMTSIAHSTTGFEDVDITPHTGVTPYAKLKNWPVFLVSLCLLIAGIVATRSRAAREFAEQ